MGLPLRMNNLHAPTVSSGPTTAGATNGGPTTHFTLPELQRSKKNMEAELTALSRVLDSHGVDMDTSLLTQDGFPRSDIDVAQIRTTRARIIHLRNDYKDLISTIQKQLNDFLSSVVDSVEAHDVPNYDPAAPEPGLDETFAKVTMVTPNGPAATAGLQPGDLIRNFGWVNKANNDELKKVSECVRGNVGREIIVKVIRLSAAPSQRELQLTLVPRRDWGGIGVLGCYIMLL